MKFTNTQGLPEPLVRAVTNDPYNRGERTDFSVTQLLGPPRIRILRKRHHEQIVEDVADRIYALLGQSVHAILERAEVEGALAEVRLYAEVDGMTISGQLDRAVFFPDGLLQDYKLTSIWADPEKPEWEQQLNLLAFLLRENGRNVSKAQIVAIYRDWSKRRARNDPSYPQHQARPIDVPLWPHEKALEFLRERIRIHVEAEWSLPECTPDERWYRGEQWALMKHGNKKATALFEFKDIAEKALADKQEKAKKGEAYRLEYRPGINVRCSDFCPVADFCDFAKTLSQTPLEAQLKASLEAANG